MKNGLEKRIIYGVAIVVIIYYNIMYYLTNGISAPLILTSCTSIILLIYLSLSPENKQKFVPVLCIMIILLIIVVGIVSLSMILGR